MPTLALTTGTNLDSSGTIQFSFSASGGLDVASGTVATVNNLPSLAAVADSASAVLVWDIDYLVGSDDDVILYGALVNSVTNTVLVGAAAGTWDGTTEPATTGYQIVNQLAATPQTFASSDTGAGGVYVNPTAADWTASGGSVVWKFWQQVNQSMANDGGYFELDRVQFTIDYTGLDVLTSTDVDSDSNVTTPTLDQVHNLTAAQIDSTPEVPSATVTQNHSFTASQIDADSNVTTPDLTENHNFTALQIDADSNVTTPTVAQSHILTVTQIDSDSNINTPAVNQNHSFTVLQIDSEPNVSTPDLVENHIFTVGQIDSTPEVPTMDLVENHAFTIAGPLEANTEVPGPTVALLNIVSTDTDITDAAAETASGSGTILIQSTDINITDRANETASGNGFILIQITDNLITGPINEIASGTGTVAIHSTDVAIDDAAIDTASGYGYQQRPSVFINLPESVSQFYINV